MTKDKAPTPGDSLGDRIKKYEAVTRPFLTPNQPVFIRVDGKAFHTWARHMDKPFDMGLVQSMQDAAVFTARQMQGFKLAYVQSDEATFMITDTDAIESQPWFGNNANKIVSITASMFTFYFNESFRQALPGADVAPAFFDARAFSVPYEDAANVFIWRQRDWERNSLSMLGYYVCGHSRMQNQKRRDVHDLLHQFGVNWADLEPVLKNGTWIDRDGKLSHEKLIYAEISERIGA